MKFSNSNLSSDTAKLSFISANQMLSDLLELGWTTSKDFIPPRIEKYSRWHYLEILNPSGEEYTLTVETETNFTNSLGPHRDRFNYFKIKLLLRADSFRKLISTSSVTIKDPTDYENLTVEDIPKLLDGKFQALAKSVSSRYDTYKKKENQARATAISQSKRQQEWKSLLKHLKISQENFAFCDSKCELIQLRVGKDDEVLAMILAAITGKDKKAILKLKLTANL